MAGPQALSPVHRHLHLPYAVLSLQCSNQKNLQGSHCPPLYTFELASSLPAGQSPDHPHLLLRECQSACARCAACTGPAQGALQACLGCPCSGQPGRQM
eukprot:1162143-Pelagomonas_calceolata.AAC.38